MYIESKLPSNHLEGSQKDETTTSLLFGPNCALRVMLGEISDISRVPASMFLSKSQGNPPVLWLTRPGTPEKVIHFLQTGQKRPNQTPFRASHPVFAAAFGSRQDMYQLIDHIFYEGRHLFRQGEQALRLREKHLGRHKTQMGDPPQRNLGIFPR